jgi:hypothetical protein
MTALYILLKVIALLAVIIVPLIGPKKKKLPATTGISDIAVNEEGYLEHYTGKPGEHYPVH